MAGERPDRRARAAVPLTDVATGIHEISPRDLEDRSEECHRSLRSDGHVNLAHGMLERFDVDDSHCRATAIREDRTRFVLRQA